MNEAMQKLIDAVQRASPVIWQAAYRQVYIDLAEMVLCVIGLLFVARALMLWRKEYIISELGPNPDTTFNNPKWDLPALGLALGAMACYLISAILDLYIMDYAFNPTFAAIKELKGLL